MVRSGSVVRLSRQPWSAVLYPPCQQWSRRLILPRITHRLSSHIQFVAKADQGMQMIVILLSSSIQHVQTITLPVCGTKCNGMLRV